MKRFENKVIIVTGAASGMGRESALRMAAEGGKLVLGDINEQGLQQTAADIDAAGGTAMAVTFNAMEEESCKALVASAVDSFGRLDVVVNAAGIGGFYRLDELSSDILNRFMTINLNSVIIICREAMPHLQKSKGAIVNFASVNAKVMTAYQTAYCASKAAVAAVTKCLAQEFEADGVRANVICPGGIETAMVEKMRFPEGMDFGLIANIRPLSRMGKSEEVAALVAFLASHEASYINGEDIFIDGGTHSAL